MRRYLCVVTTTLALAGCYHSADNEIDDDLYSAPDGDADSDADGDADADGDCLGIPCAEDGAPVIHVADDALAGGDGLSWEAAFDSIQKAIDVAGCLALECGAPAQVWIAEGTYYVFENDADDAVRLEPGVALYGGFAGDEHDLAARAPGQHVTVLDGRPGPDSEQRVRHVVIGSDDALIDGFTVTGGRAEGDGTYDACGGGLLAVFASPTVRHVTFLENGAGACGGGGMYVRGGSPAVTGCVFVGNTVTGASGAGALVTDGTLELATTVFLGNHTDGDGGALAVRGAAAQLERCSFLDNQADGYGGALHVLDGSEARLRGCEIAGNTAEGGGAISAGDSDLEATNSVIYDNSAYWGGAIYVLNNHSTELVNCTFTKNYAEEQGGALLQTNGANECETRIVGSIFWDDSPGEIDLQGTALDEDALTIAFNDIQGGGSDLGQGNIDADPLFADPADDDLALLAGSPCIDRADDATAPTTDMLGHARVEVADTGTEGTVADMGAIEYLP